MNEPFDKAQDKIIPAILPTNASDLNSKLAQLPEEIKLAHLDVLEEDIWSDKVLIDFEVHLMVRRPNEIIERWVDRGAKRIIVHELGEETKEFKDRVEIGLAVELHVPLEYIYPLVPEVKFLHLMSIAEIGAQGHPLDEKIFDRIRDVRKKFPELEISVDGGVKAENWEKLKSVGATRFVVGSGFENLWNSLTKN